MDADFNVDPDEISDEKVKPVYSRCPTCITLPMCLSKKPDEIVKCDLLLPVFYREVMTLNSSPVGLQELETPRFMTAISDHKAINIGVFPKLIFVVERRSFDRGIVSTIYDGKVFMTSRALDLRPHIMHPLLHKIRGIGEYYGQTAHLR